MTKRTQKDYIEYFSLIVPTLKKLRGPQKINFDPEDIMKKNHENLISETNKNTPAIRPKSLRPTPSLIATKSLKPKVAVVRPLKVVKGPVVG